jgi:2-dehydro-3-deoxyphosphogluconate aldolase/(4S)-4-hydroxy-2-oxoglutarate aldolase
LYASHYCFKAVTVWNSISTYNLFLKNQATMSLRAATSLSAMASRVATKRTMASAAGLDRVQTKDNFDTVLDKFAQIRACAVLRTATSEACPKAMAAAIDGGFKIVEFTLTTPDCLQHLADFRTKYDGDVMVGCGTILTPEDAANAVDAGSEFIITPVMLPDVIEWCAERNIVCVPGCQTPTEMVNAYRHGAPLQKLFPGVAGGPGWVKAVSSALPFLSINPTSGVDLDNAGDYLRMGAASVGLVAPLFDPAAIAKGDFEQIAKNAAKVMANVREVGPYVRKA